LRTPSNLFHEHFQRHHVFLLPTANMQDDVLNSVIGTMVPGTKYRYGSATAEERVTWYDHYHCRLTWRIANCHPPSQARVASALAVAVKHIP
jgi:hypothetical protein